MRSMRLKNREIKRSGDTEELIDDCVVVRIGAMDKEGMFIVPVNYGYEWEDIKDSAPSLKLYFHSASQGRKAGRFFPANRLSPWNWTGKEVSSEEHIPVLILLLIRASWEPEDSETDRSR